MKRQMKRQIYGYLLSGVLCGLCALCPADVSAQAKIQFEKKSHDFGRIDSKGGTVTAVYPFTNTGDKPLIIISVTNGGCGCTKPSFPTAPIAPGAKGEITIHFDPTGRSGSLNRKVLVQTNAGKRREGLTFTGVVTYSGDK